MDYVKLANEYGTPFYIYDKNVLLNRVLYLKSKLGNVGLVFAIKANAFLVKELSNEVERLEICSKGEYDIANGLNISGKKMVISGVYKNEDEIRSMMKDNGILRYTCESYNQYLLIKKLSEELNKDVNVLLRLTSGNQFGMNEEELYKIYKDEINNVHFHISGIQYFSGTQKHSNKRNLKELTYLSEIISKIEKELNVSVEEVEYGTGFPIFYFNEEFDEDAFLDEFREYLNVLGNKKIYLEIGRSLVASAGSYVTKVVDIKKNDVGNFAIVDGGMNHLVYYGQTMAMKVPEFEVLPKKNKSDENYNICGALCTINDIIVKQVQVGKLEIGDILVFKNTGAYTSTEGIALFLSRDLPKALLYDDGKITILRDTVKTSLINGPIYK